MYGWNMTPWGSGGWLVMGLVMLTFWAVVVFGVVALVRVTAHHDRPAPRESVDSARQILRERLARGEISPEEYATRVEVLSRPDR